MILLQGLPTAIFLVILRLSPPKTATDWQMPFIIAAATAVGVTVFLILKKEPLNRLCLGMNLHLATGGLAFITHQFWLNAVYDQLRASGMLLWITGVGVVTTLCTAQGFVGRAHPDRGRVAKYSWILVAAALLAAAVSYAFAGNRLMSQIIPFTGLFIIQGVLKNRLADRQTSQKAV